MVGQQAPPKMAATAAERKEAADKRARQLDEQIAAWRHKLLRRACTLALADGRDDGLRIVLAYAADDSRSWNGLSFGDVLEQVCGREFKSSWWPVVGGIADPLCALHGAQDGQAVILGIAKLILAHETDDHRRPTLPHALVEGYAAALESDVAEEWREIQDVCHGGNSDTKREPGGLAGGDLLEEFFLLFRTEELRELSKELGFYAGPNLKTAADIRKMLLAVPQGTTRLKLPKAIKPLAAAKKPGKAKAKKAAKRGTKR
jgi:hypothetical protein